MRGRPPPRAAPDCRRQSPAAPRTRSRHGPGQHSRPAGIVGVSRAEEEPRGGIPLHELLDAAVDQVTGTLEDEMRIVLDEGPGIAVERIATLAAGHDDELGERGEQLGDLVEAGPHEERNPPLGVGASWSPHVIRRRNSGGRRERGAGPHVVPPHVRVKGRGGRLLAGLAGKQGPGCQKPRPAGRLGHHALVADGWVIEPHGRVVDEGPLDVGEVHLFEQFVGRACEAEDARAVGAEAALQSKNFMRPARRWGIRFPVRGEVPAPPLTVHVCRRM